MENFKKNPKQKNIYPELLHRFEKNRRRDWLKAGLEASKRPLGQNLTAKSLNVRNLQMFSGKRGK
jgi:hypothetical protein